MTFGRRWGQPIPKSSKAPRLDESTSKFGNVRQTYNGRVYHSLKEARYAASLDLLLSSNHYLDVKPQHRIDIKINGIHWRNYYIDFRCVRHDGIIEYHEVKGFETEAWKMKWDALHILKDTLLEPGAILLLIK